MMTALVIKSIYMVELCYWRLSVFFCFLDGYLYVFILLHSQQDVSGIYQHMEGE